MAIALTLLAGGSASCGGEDEGGEAGPEALAPGAPVVWITIDTLRADHLSCYGHERETTPHLDRLAAEGILFRNCLAQCSWTLPSMVSMFSSLSPPVFGIGEGLKPLRHAEGEGEAFEELELSAIEYFAEEHVTLTEVLRDAGYLTAGFSTNGHLTRRQGFAQGFDHFDETTCMWGRAPALLDASLAWLEGRERERFFLWAHLFDPHHDRFGAPPRYNHPPRYAEAFAGAPAGTPAESTKLDYDRSIRSMDDEIGHFLAALEERGILDRAVVVVSADHGEEFDEHGEWGHSRSVRNTLVHVPLIVRLPGGAHGGTVVEDPVRNLDVAPTLLKALGLAVPTEMEGQDLLAALRGDRFEPLSSYGETRRFGLELHYWFDPRSGRKLVLDAKTGTVQLFDVAADPFERVDLSEREPELRARLEARLRAALTAMEARQRSRVGEELIPGADLEELRTLGYVR